LYGTGLKCSESGFNLAFKTGDSKMLYFLYENDLKHVDYTTVETTDGSMKIAKLIRKRK